jgi:hypothetical protein
MWSASRLGSLHEELRDTDAGYVELERKLKDLTAVEGMIMGYALTAKLNH